MSEETEIVSDADIDAVWGNANFGDYTRRQVVRMGVLKCASGYHQGHTSTQIITELHLVGKEYKLTAKGRMFLWDEFNDKTHF